MPRTATLGRRGRLRGSPARSRAPLRVAGCGLSGPRAALPLILSIAACSSPQPPPPAHAPPPARDWSAPADFGGLREEYGERRDFFEICEADRPLREWFERGNDGDWESVVTSSRAWLSHCPVDIDAHFVSAVALSQLDREAEAQEHARWFRGLLASVLGSGDGRTPHTAYAVISIPEEYAVLRALRLEFKQQALLDGRIDALTVEGASGRTTLYFDPAAHFRRLARELGKGR
jgi:hypothetical protein